MINNWLIEGDIFNPFLTAECGGIISLCDGRFMPAAMRSAHFGNFVGLAILKQYSRYSLRNH
jgi:hypothetical protein